MSDLSYDEALVDQNRKLGSLLRDADWSTPVPTCPGWTVLQVLRHVGRGDRWAAQIVRKGDGDVDPRQVPDGRPPDDATGAVEWLSAGPRTLLNAVISVGADTPVWTFIGPQPASWWIRRRLHEATVHRADTSLALGRDYELEPELAADGISEWVALAGVLFTPEQGISLEATDRDGQQWRLGPAGSEVAAPEVTLRGSAVELLLALSGRTGAAELEVDGDRDVWDRWLSGVQF